MVPRCPPLGCLPLGRFPHVAYCCQSCVEGRAHIRVQDEVPQFVVEVVEGAVPRGPGVVDQDVQGSELIDGASHQGPRGPEPGRVVRGDERASADGLDGGRGLLRRLHVDVVDHHHRALPGESHRRCATDPAARTRDDGDPSIQASHAANVPSALQERQHLALA